MSQEQILTQLLGIQGWEVIPDGIQISEQEVRVPICPIPHSGFHCSGCRQGLLFVYDYLPLRRVRDFPVWGKPTYLEVQLPRVDCPRCGVRLAQQDWIEPDQRLTLRYEKYVAALCDILPALDVAEHEGLNKDTVYRLDRKWLQRRAAERIPRAVRYLGIDEIAIKKGHKYATVFYDLERRAVLGLVKGRTQRQASRFFRRQGKEWCKQVQAVCMDLWSAYLNSVRRYCRKAEVVFDKFHVFGYLNEAIDAVRRAEQNQATAAGKNVLKGCRWVLLKATGTLGRKDKHRLEELVQLNKPLQKAVLLKEEFEQFYQSEDAAAAEQFLQDWARRCRESRLPPFERLAKRLLRWSFGIVAYFRWRLTNAVAEGINNKIKVLKRRSYGFHDEEYFFLKILNATGALPPWEALTHSL